MAAIDKTYLQEEEYAQVVEWCKKIGKVKHPLSGFTFRPFNYIYYPDKKERDEVRAELREEQAKRGHVYDEYLVLWNTPKWFDYWLVKECPLDFIQDQVVYQYGEEWVEAVKNGTSIYDTYERNGLGQNLDVKILRKPKWDCRVGYYFPHYNKKFQRWLIDVYDDNKNYKYAGIECSDVSNHDLWSYNEHHDVWVNINKELIPWTCSGCMELRDGPMCFKTILRKLRKWNLPAGLTICLSGMWKGQEWTLVTIERKNKKKK